MYALPTTWRVSDLPRSQLAWLVMGASLVLSVWGAYAQFVPNPDAILYLQAAELFAQGAWREGLQVYRWPVYSLCIALVIALTGLPGLLAAHVVNALFDAATAWLFVALVARLAGGRTQLMFWAAAFVLLHPKLVQLRPVIIRDHGFFALFMLALYLVVCDRQRARMLTKLSAVAAIGGAALFRFEAAFLLLVVPAFYVFERASTLLQKASIVGIVLAACVLFLPAYTLWIGMTAYAVNSLSGLVSVWSMQIDDVFKGVRTIAAQLAQLLPPSRNVGIVAYTGIVVALAADGMLRALTIPIAGLAVLAFVPNGLMAGFAARFVGWFALWQLPLLITFTAFALFLDWRYAMAFAVVAGIPAVFTLDAAAGGAYWGGRKEKVLFAAALAALIVPFALAVPRFSNLSYLRDAGLWVRDSLPANAIVVTNDARVAYYSGRTDARSIRVHSTSTVKNHLDGADYLLLHVERATVPSVPGLPQSGAIMSFSGVGNRRVVGYALR